MRPIVIVCLLFTWPLIISAQTTLDTNPENVYSVSANLAKLEKSGYKYYTMDVPGKQCRLYNLDHSPFRTFNLVIPEGYDLYDIQQVSEHLFNSDDLVEIVYISYRYNETETGWWYYTYETSLVNENGEVLLNIPGAGHTEVFDLGEDGKKFLVWIYNYSVYPYIIHTNVYNLPEQSQTTKAISLSEESQLLGNPYPNPTSGNFTVPLNLAIPKGYLNIHNLQGGILRKIEVSGLENNIVVPTDGLGPGTYMINIHATTGVSSSKKLIIN
jgi:hypothetical protein